MHLHAKNTDYIMPIDLKLEVLDASTYLHMSSSLWNLLASEKPEVLLVIQLPSSVITEDGSYITTFFY